jgi:hypothetical protein
MFDVLRAVPQASRAAELIVQWAIATVQGSERPVALTREYAAYWGKSERQGLYDRAAIRALFDADEFDRVIERVADELRARGVTVPPADGEALEIPDDVVTA